MKHKYNYFYKITNLINNHYYYGVHSTDNLNDGYMGSGKRLGLAIKKYGIENFKKEIIKLCNNRDEAYELEEKYVTESLIKSNDCYNIILGGKQPANEYLVAVKDKEGKTFLVHKDDPRYLNGELVGVVKGKFVAKDKYGKIFLTDINDKNFECGEISGVTCGNVTLKDKNGNYYWVHKDDPRYLNGELVGVWSGKKHSDETIKKIKTTLKLINHQKGEKNSQFGTCWVTKNGENKKIKKEELNAFIQNGWNKGRVIKNR